MSLNNEKLGILPSKSEVILIKISTGLFKKDELIPRFIGRAKVQEKPEYSQWRRKGSYQAYLKCTVINSTTGSGNISCTTVAGALVEVLGQSPVTFMKSYTADSNGKISLTVPQEGSYLVQATKSGYTSTKYIATVTKKKELKAGNKVTLKNGYFYSSATATKSATKTKKSGTYYIWSSTIKNGRIRITTKSGYAGKSGKITAWVNVSDLVY